MRAIMWPKVFVYTGLFCICLVGCARDGDEIARRWVAKMDAKPPEERVANWDNTRAMMMREAPKVGDVAPDFTLETRDGNETIRLSQFRSDPQAGSTGQQADLARQQTGAGRPVVLIFGSWT